MKIPRWRIAAAGVVVAAMIFLAAKFTPIYIHNLELQNFVTDLAAHSPSQPDNVLRAQVLDRARGLDLPVLPGDVAIDRSPDRVRIEVRYIVRVNAPGYTVDLHFYPGAGSR